MNPTRSKMKWLITPGQRKPLIQRRNPRQAHLYRHRPLSPQNTCHLRSLQELWCLYLYPLCPMQMTPQNNQVYMNCHPRRSSSQGNKLLIPRCPRQSRLVNRTWRRRWRIWLDSEGVQFLRAHLRFPWWDKRRVLNWTKKVNPRRTTLF